MDELDEDERILFEKHLNNCPICSRELILERSLQNGLAECMKPGEAPAELRLNVLTKILTVQRPRFPFWQVAATLFSGAAVFFILMKILSGSGLPSESSGFLIGVIDGISAAFEQTNSLPLLIGAAIAALGIISVVASLLPEE